ncbi:nitroreductase family protein [Streptomyces sp. NPDC001070]
MSRSAVTAVPVHPPLAERWSPRSFDAAHELTDPRLAALPEAARWAASAHNVQPWRFLVGRRGDTTFKGVHDTLIGFNQQGARNASALIAVASRDRRPLGETFFAGEWGEPVALRSA